MSIKTLLGSNATKRCYSDMEITDVATNNWNQSRHPMNNEKQLHLSCRMKRISLTWSNMPCETYVITSNMANIIENAGCPTRFCCFFSPITAYSVSAAALESQDLSVNLLSKSPSWFSLKKLRTLGILSWSFVYMNILKMSVLASSILSSFNAVLRLCVLSKMIWWMKYIWKKNIRMARQKKLPNRL